MSREEDILEVLRSHSAYELAQLYLFNVEEFCELVLEVLDLGALATKVFILMYQHRREWATVELAGMVKDHRSNVYVALRLLEKKGFVQRVSRTKWRFSGSV